MGEFSESILSGEMCMSCMILLLDNEGKICNAGHPVYCEDCWKELPKHEKRSAPYFDE